MPCLPFTINRRSLNDRVLIAQKSVLEHPHKFFRETGMISDVHWTILEDGNRQLRLCLAKLRKTRATGDSDRIQNAEMDYFQALQHLYTSVQDAT